MSAKRETYPIPRFCAQRVERSARAKSRDMRRVRQDMHIDLTSGNKDYLNYHRENLYKS